MVRLGLGFNVIILTYCIIVLVIASLNDLIWAYQLVDDVLRLLI